MDNSNVRWHKTDCNKASIIVDDGVPRCQNCHATSSVLVARLVSENQVTQGLIHLPEEAPLGKADLWWPPCVPWRNKIKRIWNDEGLAYSSTDGASMASSSTLQPIYSSSLGSETFRLLYITESESTSSPIHIRLKEYALDDCPQYETVSYAWGGEDGDSTPCKPVYVGPFWDVVLATKNCSALLRYLRPQVGSRIIWLDAICINQADNGEKVAQISIMADIYTECACVVVFFGEDLVQQPPDRRHFRRRVELSEECAGEEEAGPRDLVALCADSAGLRRDQLLQRRYLSRIWIVQELVLPKRAILPLGCVDILCAGQRASQLVFGPNSQELPPYRSSLSQFLTSTSNCLSSDPRDKIYGLLGLYTPCTREGLPVRDTLKSDYSISWRDCLLGIGAYMLLVERDFGVLVHAVGNSHEPTLPSWVPDMTRAKCESTFLIDPMRKATLRNLVITREPGDWATEFVMYSAEAHLDAQAVVPSNWWAQKSHRFGNGAVGSRYRSGFLDLKESSVDSVSGALRIKAVCVFDTPHRLTVEDGENGLTWIWVRGPSTSARFGVKGNTHHLISDETYGVFIVPGPEPVVFFLANLVLHQCCALYEARFYSKDHLRPKSEFGWLDHADQALHSQADVKDAMYYGHSLRTCDPDNNGVFRLMLPCQEAMKLNLRPLQTFLFHLAELERSLRTSPGLIKAVSAAAQIICPEFEPLIRDDWFYLTLKDERMFETWAVSSAMKRYSSTTCSLQVARAYELARDKGDRTTSIELDSQGWASLDEEGWHDFWEGKWVPVAVRLPLDFLVSLIRRSDLYTAGCYAREFCSHLDEDIETFLAHDAAGEDSYVFLEGWGPGLVNELGLVWKPQLVTIV